MAAEGYMPRAKTTEWQTPPELFDRLWDEYGPFDLDPCCRPEHYTARRILAAGGVIYDPRVDGLGLSWRGNVYLNPPYGREIGRWVRKATEEVGLGRAKRVVALLPARTDTSWWQEYVLTCVRRSAIAQLSVVAVGLATEVYFLRGRLRFAGATGRAPFPSAIVVWE